MRNCKQKNDNGHGGNGEIGYSTLQLDYDFIKRKTEKDKSDDRSIRQIQQAQGGKSHASLRAMENV